MEFLQLIILSVIIFSIAFLGLAVRILIKRGGKFPSTHVGGNKHLSRQGIYCARTQDRIEQNKLKSKTDYKNVRLIKNKNDSQLLC
jgi:hypothetical protein